MSEAESSKNDVLLDLKGRVTALEIVCSLLINQFAGNDSLRADFARTLNDAVDNIPLKGDLIFRKGIVRSIKKITDGLIVD